MCMLVCVCVCVCGVRLFLYNFILMLFTASIRLHRIHTTDTHGGLRKCGVDLHLACKLMHSILCGVHRNAWRCMCSQMSFSLTKTPQNKHEKKKLTITNLEQSQFASEMITDSCHRNFPLVCFVFSHGLIATRVPFVHAHRHTLTAKTIIIYICENSKALKHFEN